MSSTRTVRPELTASAGAAGAAGAVEYVWRAHERTRAALADAALFEHVALAPGRVRADAGTLVLRLDPGARGPRGTRLDRRIAACLLVEMAATAELAGFGWDEGLAAAVAAEPLAAARGGLPIRPRYALAHDGAWWDLPQGRPAAAGAAGAARQRTVLAASIAVLEGTPAGGGAHRGGLIAAARALNDPFLAEVLLRLLGEPRPLARLQDAVFEMLSADPRLLADARVRRGLAARVPPRGAGWDTACRDAGVAGRAVRFDVCEGAASAPALLERLGIDLGLAGWRVARADGASPWLRLGAVECWTAALAVPGTAGGAPGESALEQALERGMTALPENAGVLLALPEWSSLDGASGDVLRGLTARRWPRALIVAASGRSGADGAIELGVEPLRVHEIACAFPLLLPASAGKEQVFEEIRSASNEPAEASVAVTEFLLSPALEAVLAGRPMPRMRREPDASNVPPEVTGALANLTQDERHVLAAALVAGDELDEAALTGLGCTAARAGLARLCAVRLAEAEHGLDGAPRYRLRSPIAARLALASLPAVQRCELHARRAETLAGVSGSDPRDIFLHALAGELPAPRLRGLATAAAAAAVAEGAIGEALRVLGEARPPAGPESQAWAEREAELLARAGQYRDALARLDEAGVPAISPLRLRALRLAGDAAAVVEAVRRAGSAPELEVAALCEGARAAATQALPDEARRLAGLALARLPLSSEELAAAHLAAAYAAIEEGGEALPVAERHLAEAAVAAEETAELLRARGHLAVAGGRRDMALALFERARRQALGQHDLALAAELDIDLGSAHYECGRPGEARAAWSRAVTLGERVQGGRAVLLGRYNQTVLAIDEGRFAEAEHWLGPLAARARAEGNTRNLLFALTEQARLALRQGRLGEARNTLAEALPLAAASGERLNGREVHALAADLAWLEGDLRGCAMHLADAAGAPETHGDPLWLAGLVGLAGSAASNAGGNAAGASESRHDELLAAAAGWLAGGRAPAVSGDTEGSWDCARRVLDLCLLAARRGASPADLAGAAKQARECLARLGADGYGGLWPAPDAVAAAAGGAHGSHAGADRLLEALASYTEAASAADGAAGDSGRDQALALLSEARQQLSLSAIAAWIRSGRGEGSDEWEMLAAATAPGRPGQAGDAPGPPRWDVAAVPWRRDGACAWLGDPGGELALATEFEWSAPAAPPAALRLLLRVLAERVTPRASEPEAAGEGALPGLVFASPTMRDLARRARQLAAQSLDLLLLGESGTGKEVLARALHAVSPRRAAPWHAFNCSAVPESMLERELFGHAKGAFTGADQSRPGLLAAAEGGTFLLDEIGDLAPPVQVKLLRIVQEREYYPLGQSRSMRADLRFLFATHKDLRREIEAGRFREDLYYRINVAALVIPPLRDRREDIPLLADSFLAAACREQGKTHVRFGSPARRVLGAAPWPGNVRQLRNVVASACALATSGTQIEPSHLRELIASSGAPERPPAAAAARPAWKLASGSYQEQLEQARRVILEEALERHGGNRTRAAKDLGISRQALTYLVRELGLPLKIVRGRS